MPRARGVARVLAGHVSQFNKLFQASSIISKTRLAEKNTKIRTPPTGLHHLKFFENYVCGNGARTI